MVYINYSKSIRIFLSCLIKRIPWVDAKVMGIFARKRRYWILNKYFLSDRSIFNKVYEYSKPIHYSRVCFDIPFFYVVKTWVTRTFVGTIGFRKGQSWQLKPENGILFQWHIISIVMKNSLHSCIDVGI